MNSKQIFKQYYARLSREGLIKSLLCGLIAGFAVNAIVAFGLWFVALKPAWLSVLISLAAGVVTAAIATPVFYYKLFRPTTRQIARRLDSLGLEERLITMAELEHDQSYIAMRQREDAQAKLSEVNSKDIKTKISVWQIAAASLCAVLGVTMTTLAGLAGAGYVPSGNQTFTPPEPLPKINVCYIVEEGGYIEGPETQLVEMGQTTQAVTAVADEGWAFAGWDDNLVETPVRSDEITQDPGEDQVVFFTALFEELPDPEDGEEGDGGEGEPDEGADKPQQDSENPEESDPGQQDPGKPDSGEGLPGNVASGRYEGGNQIIDGETFYGDDINYYYELAMQYLRSGQDVPEYLKDIIESYFGIIL